MKRIKLIISGLVQGVFFRRFVNENAIKLNLSGYVKNLENDQLEVMIEGDPENIDTLISLCEKGPKNSRVDKIKIICQDVSNGVKKFDNFIIQH